MRFRELAGEQFGQLTAQWPAGIRGEKIVWLCQCSCGKLHLAQGSNMTSGVVKSCGCGQVSSRKTLKNASNEYRPTWRSYHSARHRCINPKMPSYPEYGGRGIEFRFKDFWEFLTHVGPRPAGTTIDRKDPNGHYEIGNVRWATPKQQANNRRKKAA